MSDEKLAILVVEDETEVLDSIIRDLSYLENHFQIEGACSAKEAQEILNELKGEGIMPALILCDHLMPEITGIELLVQMHQEEFTKETRKVLITAQAGHEDTIEAINRAELNHYISKPWKKDELINVVKKQLGLYVAEFHSSPLDYAEVLSGEDFIKAVSKKSSLEEY